jgi:hypothetical protein
MKRVMAVAVAVMLTALVAVNAPAQSGGKVTKAKKLEAKKIDGELAKETPEHGYPRHEPVEVWRPEIRLGIPGGRRRF